MPRYFFHRTDGDFDPDREGTELPNLNAARLEAIRYAAETVKDSPDQIWSSTPFRIEVSDDTGMLLSTVIILEIEAPAARGLRGSQVPDFAGR
ncbi:DUF6894 family protein [Lichenibacterium ramalinae]|uniref:DUF6894 domain-containing protein n=1 Tax=Lichenibacterium ramalinae TaxID=2316527 RepID=A0A4Q2R506_9HYPH|nr:hypothetical protein [Lichenibacterium ramalinae]RYB01412.1 hypothetical protein D3272_26155 [Lichenibacterium ramalinae]